MGKKTKKTRWRTLPIEVGASSNDHDKNHNHYHHHHREDTAKLSSSPVHTETKIYFNEDEYTKITTPRQDVLFKKGYFARRRHQLATAPPVSDPSAGYEVPTGDYLEGDYMNEDYDSQGYYNTPHNYVDPSVGMYYNYGNNSYEVFDPFTGSMTVLMGPGAPQYPPGANPQQLVAPLSGPPMPVDWYSPPSVPPHHTPYYPHPKHYTGDSSQAYTSPESMCPPTSPQELCDDPTLYPHSFIYPGYMLSSAYHTHGGGGVPVLTSLPESSPCDSSSFKKRKRRKKRKREGVAEEEYESSSEDQCSQSGASEQLDSKTTSDSGVHTHNSGESTPVTPPLSISFHPHVPCHPIPPFTSTDEDSTPDMTASMPCFSSQIPVNYAPYHHINYNYNSDTLASSTSSVIDQQYVMHNKSKKLKNKKPKADFDKFFPSPSLNSNPCSFHSRDLSVPSSQPAPKQLTILKPDTPRKFPPTQITILKSNNSMSSQNECSINTQNKDSKYLPTKVTDNNEVSNKSTSTLNNVLTKNDTNKTICSTSNCQQNVEEDEGIVNDNIVSVKIKKDDSTDSSSSSEVLSKSSKMGEECMNTPGEFSEAQTKQTEVKNTHETHIIQDCSNLKNDKMEKRHNHQQSSINEVVNGETTDKSNTKELIINGHNSKSQDKYLKRSPSPSVKNINGFQGPDNSKLMENSFEKLKQKTKKNKTNQINGSHMNGCVKNQTSSKNIQCKTLNIEKEELSTESKHETILPCNGIKKDFLEEVKKSRIEESKNVEKSSQETFDSELCLEKRRNLILDSHNGALDYTAEDKFETCSDKSEELEELYIKNNPLLANLVGIESLNNNKKDIKDKNTITQDKKLPDTNNTTKNNKMYNTVIISKNKNSDKKHETEDKYLENTIIESINNDDENKNKQEEISKTQTLDTNKRLTNSKETKGNETKSETSKSNKECKKKPEKKKKLKEDKVQPPVKINGIKNKKEKSPEPAETNNKSEVKEPIKEICTEKKIDSLEPAHTNNKSEVKEPIKEICTEKKIDSLGAKILENHQENKQNTEDIKRYETDIKHGNNVQRVDRKSSSPDQSPKRKNSKKKKSPAPPENPSNKETTIDTAKSFIDEMISEAVNKVKNQVVENTTQMNNKPGTTNVITPDIPLQDNSMPKLEPEVKLNREPKTEIKNRKNTRKDSSKSIKKQTKPTIKTPERKSSEPQVAMPVLHITDVVNKWLEEKHGGKLPVDYLDEDEDDEEVFVQPILKTGSKNLQSNPSPAAFPKEIMGERVADRTSDISDRCNAKDCVSKYYNLGIRTSPENEVLSTDQNETKETQFKYPASSIPCGICCIIQ